MRLLFLAVDCLGWPWFERHWLPDLPDNLVYGKLIAPLPVTGPSWTSILTGMTVEQHGVTDTHGRPRDGSKSFMDLYGRYLSDVLPGSVGMFNMPCTFPPRGRRGDWMISGYPYPPATFPTCLLDGMDYIGDAATLLSSLHPVQDLGEPFWPDVLPFRDVLTLLDLVERLHLRALSYLPVPSYLFVATTYFDRVAHAKHGARDPDPDPFDRAARYCLEWANQVIKRYPADTVVIASDHGWDESLPGHDGQGIWAAWGRGVHHSGRRDMANHELRGFLESVLSLSDPRVQKRLEALGYA